MEDGANSSADPKNANTMDPAELSLRDAMTLASRLKMRVWIGLFVAAGTLLTGARKLST
jgi:hypothetical protein